MSSLNPHYSVVQPATETRRYVIVIEIFLLFEVLENTNLNTLLTQESEFESRGKVIIIV